MNDSKLHPILAATKLLDRTAEIDSEIDRTARAKVESEAIREAAIKSGNFSDTTTLDTITHHHAKLAAIPAREQQLGVFRAAEEEKAYLVSVEVGSVISSLSGIAERFWLAQASKRNADLFPAGEVPAEKIQGLYHDSIQGLRFLQSASHSGGFALHGGYLEGIRRMVKAFYVVLEDFDRFKIPIPPEHEAARKAIKAAK